jgi:chemotaxis methyl-accepting protein methylase
MLLGKLILTLNEQYGADLSVYDESFLLKIVQGRMESLKILSMQDYLDNIACKKNEIQSLLNCLNNTYTDFFRDPITFALLRKHILPNIISRKKEKAQMRIWVAGCSTGQEAFSIAMEVNEAIEQSRKEIYCTFIATDKSRNALQYAKKAFYSTIQLREVKLKYLDKYFKPIKDGYQIQDGMKECVRFSYYDMLESETLNPPDSVYGDFDLISCCNMLMYYNSSNRGKIIAKIVSSLSVDGVFITSEAERMIFDNMQELVPLSFASPTFNKNVNVNQ